MRKPIIPSPIHKQAGYPWGKGAKIVGKVPNAERNAATCISLPMFPELTEEEVDYVVSKCLEWDKQEIDNPRITKLKQYRNVNNFRICFGFRISNLGI